MDEVSKIVFADEFSQIRISIAKYVLFDVKVDVCKYFGPLDAEIVIAVKINKASATYSSFDRLHRTKSICAWRMERKF
jgi:hypothetical protein